MGRVPAFDPLARKGWFRSAFFWVAKQRVGAWIAINVGNRVDPHLMRATGGRVRVSIAFPTVLLTHMGARSGEERATPLTYFTDGDDVILVASQGGHHKHPAWLHNIRANPEVELWSDGTGGRYNAREAHGQERERLWDLATTFYPGFATYQGRAGERLIPVVVCTPQND